jgi:hypothetical protein
MLDADYSFIDSTYSLYNHPGMVYGVYQGRRSAPVVSNLLVDGSYEMLVGDLKGGIELYKRRYYAESVPGAANENGKIQVYPNPANEQLNISWSGILQPDVRISIINMEGQTLYSSAAPASLTHSAISVAMLPPGMYVCVLQSGVNRYYNKFTVIR